MSTLRDIGRGDSAVSNFPDQDEHFTPPGTGRIIAFA